MGSLEYVHTMIWYSQQWVNRRSRRAFLAGHKVKYDWHYRSSWMRWNRRFKDYGEPDAMIGMGTPTIQVDENGYCSIMVWEE